MNKNLHSMSGRIVLRLSMMMLMVVACVASMQAAPTTGVTVTHQAGRFVGAELVTTDVANYNHQAVHEDWNVIYATSGDLRLLYRSTTFLKYLRWYDYSNDGAVTVKASNLTFDYTGNNGSIKQGYAAASEPGGYIDYTYDGSSHKYIGCDQSAYIDYAYNSTTKKYTEPTLSQRIVYDIHPASEMATRVDALGSTDTLEVYDMIAPAGATIHIGPKYAYTYDDASSVKRYPYPNYYRTASAPKSLAGGTWSWKKDGTTMSTQPTITSGQFAEISSTASMANTDVVYTLQCTANSKTYNIARFTVHYYARATVGPLATGTAAISDTAFLEKAKLLAKQDFNFSADTDPTHVSTMWGGRKFYRKPLSPEESTFGFYDGSSLEVHPKDTASYWTEYHFVNDGYGYNATYANVFANRWNNGMDKTKGYVLYADGSQKPGTVFSINFDAELCPGAKMYFSAWVGEYPKTSTGSHAILDFIVLGVDEAGNETTLTTFTTGELTAACSSAWQRILFPLEYNSNIDFDHYRLRVVNKAKNTTNNDFFIDDVFIKVLPAPFEPIQATSPDECLTEDSKLTMYAKLDFGQVLQRTSTGTTTFYYRWIAKNVMQGQSYTAADHVRTDYLGTEGTQDYGVIVVPNNYLTLPSGYTTVADFATFDHANNQADVPAMAFVKETGLPKVGSNTNRYVAYIATPMTKNGGHYSDYYTCVVSQDLNTLGVGTSCSNMNGTPVAFGVEINSTLGGTVAGVQKQVCANYSYDLTYQAKYAILGSTGGTEVVTSKYVAHWLWGNEATVTNNPDLFGAGYLEICAAMKAYGADGNNDVVTAEQKALVKRLVQKGLLTLSKIAYNEDGTAKEAGSDVTFVVMPIDGATSLSYTAFPIAAIRSDAPHCDLPQTITLNFPSPDGPNPPDRNVIRFVKTHGESVPAYVSSRPRRVRIPYMRNGARVSEQNVPVDLSDPTHKYNVVGLTLYATDDADFTQYLKKVTAVTATGNPATITGSTSSVDFANLDALKEGKSYTFKMEYKLTDANSAEVLAGACRDDESGEIHNGEAFIQFIVVPELLYLDAEAGLTASWNDDFNWLFKQDGEVISNIAPLKETSVILADGNHILLNRGAFTVQEPANADNSNLVDPKALPYITYDINFEPYTANNVYVPAQTAITGQNNVNAVGKWTFDMPITPGKWILTAMPVQGIVSGDMFMPTAGESETDVFAVAAINQTVGQPAVDRTDNPFYNSLYNKKAIQKDVVAAYNVDITSSNWTYATNSLNTPFGAGYGWALGYNGTATDKTMRLPKVDEEYHFFNAGGYWHAMTQTADRTNVGKPAFQADKNGVMTVTLTNNTESDLFLFGNPTFGYIDLSALQAANPDITAFYQAGLTEGRYALVSGTTAEDTWRTSLPAFDGMLAPMQAVFVKATSGTSLDVVVKASMLRTKDKQYEENGQVRTGAPRRAAAATRDQVIYIEASALDFTATAAVFENEDASNDAAEEDVELFMLDKSKTPFSIFTIAGEKALAINMIDDATIVPLAMYSEKEVESEELTFTGDDSYLGEWDLVDQQSDLREALYDGMSITLMMPTTGSRYYLEHSRHFVPGTATGVDNSDLSIKAYTEMGQLTVFSDNDMADFRLYDAAGRLIMAEQNAGRVITANLIAGAYMVRANGEVLKVIVK